MKEKKTSLFNLLYKASLTKPKDAEIKDILERTTKETWSYARIGEYRKPGIGIPKKYFTLFCVALAIPRAKAKEIFFDWYTSH